MAVATINTHTKKLVGKTDIVSRGFVHVRESADLIAEAEKKVNEVIGRELSVGVMDLTILKNEVRNALSKLFYVRTKRRPVIIPVIVEV